MKLPTRHHKKNFMITVLTVLGLICLVAPAWAQTADDYVEYGKTAFFENQDLSDALYNIDEALTLDPTHEKAHFWRALFSVVDMTSNPEMQAIMQDLKVIDYLGDLLVLDAEGKLNYNQKANVDNIIIDNNDPGYSQTGTWTTLTDAAIDQPYDIDCQAYLSGSGPASATWAPTILYSGKYRVSVWVPSDLSNSPYVEYKIYSDGSLTDTVSLNQQSVAVGQWFHLGEYVFPAGGLNYVEITDHLTSGQVIADAVKFEFMENVQDDSYPTCTFTGAGWQNVTSEFGAYEHNYHWHPASLGGTATWDLGIENEGLYIVYVRWPGWVRFDETSNAQYRINYADGSSELVSVDQTQTHYNWYSLGGFEFKLGASPITLTLESTFSGTVIADAVKAVPVRPYPDLDESQMALASLLSDFSLAISHFANVSPAFSDTLILGSTTTHLDYGDAKTLEALIAFLKSYMGMMITYDMSEPSMLDLMGLNDLDIFNMLYTYPNFLTISNPSFMATARSDLEQMLQSYLLASDFIRARPDDDGLNHFITFYDPYDPLRWGSFEEWEEYKSEQLAGEEEMRDRCTALFNHFSDPGTYPLFNMPLFINGEFSASEIEMDMNEFYLDPVSLRDYILFFTESEILYDAFPPPLDPTMDGIFPTMTPSSWNHLLGNGPAFKPNSTLLWVGHEVQAGLSWEKVKDHHEAPFVRYELYRSSDPEATKATADLIATITNPFVTTFLDTTLPQDQNDYYYILHTYYDFGFGQTAESFDKIHLKRQVFVSQAYALPDPDGTRAKPYPLLAQGLAEATNGTKIYVAAGTYVEPPNTLIMSHLTNISITGGFDPVSWVRDLELYETIIDFNFTGWSGFSFHFMDNIILDGLTITHANGTAVYVSYADSANIRNCKISNSNGSAISFANTINAVVQNNLLRANSGWGISLWSNSYAICNATISNNTVVNGTNLGGIAYDFDSGDSITIQNNILYANSNGWGIRGNHGTATFTENISHNNAYNNSYGDYNNCGTSAGSDGNISEDPLFVSGPDGDYYLSQTATGQVFDSPSLNAGSDLASAFGLDYYFTTRTDKIPDGGTVDMGYHYQSLNQSGFQAPAINPIGDKVIGEGQLLEFTVSATDPNADPIALSAVLSDAGPLAAIGAAFTDNGDNTGTFSWTPVVGQGVQEYEVTFKAIDPTLAEDQQTVTITVQGPGTVINYHIYHDTTLDLLHAPYIITMVVGVDNNATLTIDPGVEVRFDDGCGITVGGVAGGNFVAQGTPEQMITFKSNVTPAPGRWEQIYLQRGASSIQYVDVRHSKFGIYQSVSSYDVSHSHFESNVWGMVFANGVNPTVTDNVLQDNYHGCLILGGVSGGTPYVSQPVFRNNVFTGELGYKVYSLATTPDDLSGYVIDAEGNDWGTTDPGVIGAKIFDGNDTGNEFAPVVDFEPYL